MYDVIIIGGGPAGLTAGLYAVRAGRNALLLEKSMTGGQVSLTNTMENYPGFPAGIGGPELAMAMVEQALGAGLKIFYDGALEIDCANRRVRTQTGWHEARRLILAVGAQPRTLGAAGEAQFVGRGISFCATCDGALYRNKAVAVIGGGNTAVEDALYLSAVADKVTLIHRRDSLRAERHLIKRLEGLANVNTLWNTQVTAFEGDTALRRLRLSRDRLLDVDAAFIAIGRLPDTKLVAGQVDMTEDGFIIAGEDCATSVPGVFVAGDARTKTLRQVVTAVADGAVAASACLEG